MKHKQNINNSAVYYLAYYYARLLKYIKDLINHARFRIIKRIGTDG